MSSSLHEYIGREFEIPNFRFSAIKASSDGKYIGCGTTGGMVQFLKIDNGDITPRKIMEGLSTSFKIIKCPISEPISSAKHRSQIVQLDISPDNTMAISGDKNGIVNIWRIQHEKWGIETSLSSNTGNPATCCKFSRNGMSVLISHGNGSLLVCSKEGAKVISTNIPEMVTCDWYGDDVLILLNNGSLSVLDASTAEQRVFETMMLQLSSINRQYPDNGDKFRSGSTPGKQLITSAALTINKGDMKHVAVGLPTGEIFIFRSPSIMISHINTKISVRSLCFSPNGMYLAASGNWHSSESGASGVSSSGVGGGGSGGSQSPSQGRLLFFSLGYFPSTTSSASSVVFINSIRFPHNNVASIDFISFAHGISNDTQRNGNNYYHSSLSNQIVVGSDGFMTFIHLVRNNNLNGGAISRVPSGLPNKFNDVIRPCGSRCCLLPTGVLVTLREGVMENGETIFDGCDGATSASQVQFSNTDMSQSYSKLPVPGDKTSPRMMGVSEINIDEDGEDDIGDKRSSKKRYGAGGREDDDIEALFDSSEDSDSMKGGRRRERNGFGGLEDPTDFTVESGTTVLFPTRVHEIRFIQTQKENYIKNIQLDEIGATLDAINSVGVGNDGNDNLAREANLMLRSSVTESELQNTLDPLSYSVTVKSFLGMCPCGSLVAVLMGKNNFYNSDVSGMGDKADGDTGMGSQQNSDNAGIDVLENLSDSFHMDGSNDADGIDNINVIKFDVNQNITQNANDMNAFGSVSHMDGIGSGPGIERGVSSFGSISGNATLPGSGGKRGDGSGGVSNDVIVVFYSSVGFPLFSRTIPFIPTSITSSNGSLETLGNDNNDVADYGERSDNDEQNNGVSGTIRGDGSKNSTGNRGQRGDKSGPYILLSCSTMMALIDVSKAMEKYREETSVNFGGAPNGSSNIGGRDGLNSTQDQNRSSGQGWSGTGEKGSKFGGLNQDEYGRASNNTEDVFLLHCESRPDDPLRELRLFLPVSDISKQITHSCISPDGKTILLQRSGGVLDILKLNNTTGRLTHVGDVYVGLQSMHENQNNRNQQKKGSQGSFVSASGGTNLVFSLSCNEDASMISYVSAQGQLSVFSLQQSNEKDNDGFGRTAPLDEKTNRNNKRSKRYDDDSNKNGTMIYDGHAQTGGDFRDDGNRDGSDNSNINTTYKLVPDSFLSSFRGVWNVFWSNDSSGISCESGIDAFGVSSVNDNSNKSGIVINSRNSVVLVNGNKLKQFGFTNSSETTGGNGGESQSNGNTIFINSTLVPVAYSGMEVYLIDYDRLATMSFNTSNDGDGFDSLVARTGNEMTDDGNKGKRSREGVYIIVMEDSVLHSMTDNVENLIKNIASGSDTNGDFGRGNSVSETTGKGLSGGMSIGTAANVNRSKGIPRKMFSVAGIKTMLSVLEKITMFNNGGGGASGSGLMSGGTAGKGGFGHVNLNITPMLNTASRCFCYSYSYPLYLLTEQIKHIKSLDKVAVMVEAGFAGSNPLGQTLVNSVINSVDSSFVTSTKELHIKMLILKGEYENALKAIRNIPGFYNTILKRSYEECVRALCYKKYYQGQYDVVLDVMEMFNRETSKEPILQMGKGSVLQGNEITNGTNDINSNCIDLGLKLKCLIGSHRADELVELVSNGVGKNSIDNLQLYDAIDIFQYVSQLNYNLPINCLSRKHRLKMMQAVGLTKNSVDEALIGQNMSLPENINSNVNSLIISTYGAIWNAGNILLNINGNNDENTNTTQYPNQSESEKPPLSDQRRVGVKGVGGKYGGLNEVANRGTNKTSSDTGFVLFNVNKGKMAEAIKQARVNSVFAGKIIQMNETNERKRREGMKEGETDSEALVAGGVGGVGVVNTVGKDKDVTNEISSSLLFHISACLRFLLLSIELSKLQTSNSCENSLCCAFEARRHCELMASQGEKSGGLSYCNTPGVENSKYILQVLTQFTVLYSAILAKEVKVASRALSDIDEMMRLLLTQKIVTESWFAQVSSGLVKYKDYLIKEEHELFKKENKKHRLNIFSGDGSQYENQKSSSLSNRTRDCKCGEKMLYYQSWCDSCHDKRVLSSDSGDLFDTDYSDKIVCPTCHMGTIDNGCCMICHTLCAIP